MEIRYDFNAKAQFEAPLSLSAAFMNFLYLQHLCIVKAKHFEEQLCKILFINFYLDIDPTSI